MNLSSLPSAVGRLILSVLLILCTANVPAFAQAPVGTSYQGPFFQAPYCTAGTLLAVTCTAGTIQDGGHTQAVTAATVSSLTATKADCAAPAFAACDIIYSTSTGTLGFSATPATAFAAGNTVLAYVTTNGTTITKITYPWSTTNTIGSAGSKFATAYNAAGTEQLLGHVVFGTCTLGTSCTITLTGAAAFTGTTTYFCAATDQTAAAATKIVNTAAGTITITGTSTDVIGYVCFGN